MILRKFRKIFQKNFGFWGCDGTSNLFVERFHTFPNVLLLDSDRTSQALQFLPDDGLAVAWCQKLLRNYEKFITKS